MPAQVLAVHTSPAHAFSKYRATCIELRAGHGLVGDAHGGVTVQHRSRVARDPSQPNLRQVHLTQGELLAELVRQSMPVQPGRVLPS